MKILISYALDSEFDSLGTNLGYNELSYVITGVGKARAAMSVMRAVIENKPDLVINVGTAGTVIHEKGDILVCNRFIDRDLRKVNIGCIRSEIVSEKIAEMPLFANMKSFYTANTGDSFVTELGNLEGDVINMETFAEADVCDVMGVPFVAVMCVSDVIGRNSVKAWEDSLTDSKTLLNNFVKKLLS